MRGGYAIGAGANPAARAWRRTLALVLAAALAVAAVAPAARPAVGQDGDDLSGLTATIARSDDGVNLRADPSFGAEVIATLPDGTLVELRIDEVDTILDQDGQTRWWPIRADGQDGWVAGYYLETAAAGETTAGEDGATDETEPPDTSDETGVAGEVTGATANARVTSEDGANLRAEPGTSSQVLAILPFDTQVELRIDEADTVVRGGVRWWPVRFDGQDGWVAGDYLADEGGVVVEDGSTDHEAVPRTFALGEYAAASTGTGEGVNIRAGAGTENERVGIVREGDVVQIMDGPFPDGVSASGWYLVTDGAVTGYVDGDYLAGADQPPAPPADADPVVPEPVYDPVYFVAGDFAAADGGVNVRSGASLDANVLTTLFGGTVVEVLAGPKYDSDGDGWYLVTDGTTTGYANGNFLVVASAPEPPPPPAPPAPASGVATGTFIVPVAGYTFTQAYGCTGFGFEPYDANLGCNFHNGIDLANNAYTDIRASDGGVVKYAGWCDCGLGYYVEIDHGNGFATVYGHMADVPYVATGQAVAQGDVIGPVGSTGLSTGPHVHFMIKLNGSTVDPLLYVSV